MGVTVSEPHGLRLDTCQSRDRPSPENLIHVMNNIAALHSQVTPLGAALSVACSKCNLRELCMPMGLSPGELDKIDELVATRRRVKRGAPLFRSGEPFRSLYAIRTGFFQ